jgi:Rieske Fe-S protein
MLNSYVFLATLVVTRAEYMMAVWHAGISLTPEQWATVKNNATAVSDSLQEGTIDFTVEMAGHRKLRVREVGSKVCVDIREYYDKDGEDAPGKKGIFSSCMQCAHLWLTAMLTSSGLHLRRH